MSGSYRQCVECGKRALRFATRCPGCGIELPNPAPLEGEGIPQLSWFHSLKGVMALLAIGVALASLQRGPASPAPLSAEPSLAADRPSETAALVRASVAAMPRVDTAASGGPAGVLLVARRWTHVRSRRTASATLEAVLTPGDTVLADSLANGWYRVALYGEVLGYARGSTLARALP